MKEAVVPRGTKMFTYPQQYDVIVVGAGHAGIEAGMAVARLGCTALVLTQNLDTVGLMSCNPAIGGQAKGQIVREIDALGGVMGSNADATAIQFRMLNARKGPSVRSPRAQCDKKAYQFRAKAVLERQGGLHLKQGSATRIIVDGAGVAGVEAQFGVRYLGKAVVVTTGTFLRALLHVGMENRPGGRMGDSASNLSDSLRELGFEVARFKTGTPCRLNGRSIDFSRCAIQEGDHAPVPFSFGLEADPRADDIFTLNRWKDGAFHVEQLPCWLTATSEKTHAIIRQNLDRSPLYAGTFEGPGPRYCPSIEDKVVKFSEKPHHQVFLEPEGRHTEENNVNGVSTSLPYEVQVAFIRSIVGLENAEIVRPGYAVEYDCCPPEQLRHTLETKNIPGLYFAGQLNGTSGYEEAAAQGLVAGANAALKVLGRPAFTLGRAEAYIGVLIDDLVTKGTPEPYRMFTSRAEHRLSLRHDNADVRLTPRGWAHGLVAAERMAQVQEKIQDMELIRVFADATNFEGVRVSHWLKRPENSAVTLPASIRGDHPLALWEACEVEWKYAGYIARQERATESLAARGGRLIPRDLDFTAISGLRTEAKQRLSAVRPETLGQAGRIPGVSPADLALLSIIVARTRNPSS